MAAQRLVEIACLPEPIDDARRQEIRAALDDDALMRRKTDPSGGAVGADQVVAGGVFYRVYADGEPIAWYVLVPGPCIAIAYGRAAFDLVEHVLPLIERQCAAAGELWIETKRPGLIKKLRAAGYAVEATHAGGAHLRKEL